MLLVSVISHESFFGETSTHTCCFQGWSAKMAAVEDTTINKNESKIESLDAVEKRIVKQIEITGVTLDCLQTFSRLKAMSVENQTLADAIKRANSKLLEVSDDDKKVRRLKSVPLPENTVEARQTAKAKTKGFPKETTLDQLEEFFGTYGNVVYIMMRRVYQTKEFKGSVFVEFTTLEEAKKFLAEEKSTYKDEELIKMLREEYYKKKEEEKSQLKDDERKRKAQHMIKNSVLQLKVKF
ncbi:Lupus La protein-like [Exaiptasia diaphana]|nr:Lupus La protein-like [Exaiptasia diaphana]